MINIQPKALQLTVTGFQVTPIHGYAALQGNYELKDGFAVVAKGTHREWSTETRELLHKLIASMEGDLAKAYGVPDFDLDAAYATSKAPAPTPAAPAVEPDLNSHLDEEPSPFLWRTPLFSSSAALSARRTWTRCSTGASPSMTC